jgi:hypothetical protein
MKVPLDLQPCVGKKELRASLRTGYLTDAKSMSRLIAGRVQQLFRKLRGGLNDMTKLDQAKINDIIRGFIKDSLDEEEDTRINRQRPFTDDDVNKRAEFLGFLQADHREALAKSDLNTSTIARQMTNDVIETHGLDIKKDSGDYRKLSREILKAHIDVLEVEKRRTLGDYGSPQEVALRESIDPSPAPVGKQRGHRDTPEQQQRISSSTMKQAGEDFISEYGGGWNARSLKLPCIPPSSSNRIGSPVLNRHTDTGR